MPDSAGNIRFGLTPEIIPHSSGMVAFDLDRSGSVSSARIEVSTVSGGRWQNLSLSSDFHHTHETGPEVLCDHYKNMTIKSDNFIRNSRWSAANYLRAGTLAMLAIFGLAGCVHSVSTPASTDLVRWTVNADDPLRSSSTIDWTHMTSTQEQRDEARSALIFEYGSEVAQYLGGLEIPVVFGEINGHFKAQFLESAARSNRIAITSAGGDVRTAIELAEYIVEAGNIELVVFGTCKSACVEYLLPAASSVVLFDSPFLGVHGNLLSKKGLALSGTSDPCPDPLSQQELIGDLTRLANRMRGIYEQTGHRESFWKSQEEKLGTPDFSFIQKSNDVCSIGLEFDYEWWFPTSEQFSELLGLELKGSLCSDNQHCYRNKMALYEDEGSEVIVGSTDFVVTK